METEGWSFSVPGQPPSGNHKDEAAIRWTKPKQLGEKARPYMGRRRAVGVEGYMLICSTKARQGRPAGWEPAKKIRVEYVLHLGRDIDGDNATKVASDAIAIALGCDDRRFLISILDKVTRYAEPHIHVTVSNLPDNYHAGPVCL